MCYNLSIGALSYFFLYLLFFTQYMMPQKLIPGAANVPVFQVVMWTLLFFIFISNKFFSFTKNKQLVWILVLYFYLTILSFLNGMSYNNAQVLRILYQFVPFMIGLCIFIDEKKKFEELIKVISCVSIIIIVYNLLNQGKFERYSLTVLPNFLQDPNDFSLFLNMIMPWIFLSSTLSRKMYMKAAYFSGGCLAILSSILTFSRGGALGLFISFILLIFLFPSPNKFYILFTFILFSLLLVLEEFDTWKEVVSKISQETPTAVTRITMWKGSLDAYMNSSFAIGPGSIGRYAYLFIPDGILNFNHFHWQGQVAHSFWITALVEWGIIGVFILCVIIGVNIRQAFELIKSNDFFWRACGAVSISSLSGFLFSSSFLTVNYYAHFWYLSCLIGAGHVIFKKDVIS